VDVGRPPLDGLGQEVVRQLHDRRVVDGALEVGDLVLLLADDLEVLVEVGDDVLELHRAVEELVDRRGDVPLGGEDELDRVAGLEADPVDDRHAGGVGDGDDHLRAHAVDGEGEVLLHHLLGEQPHDIGVDLVFGKVHHGQTELAPEEGEELLLLDVPRLHQDRADPFMGPFLGFEGAAQLIGSEQVPFKEHFPDFRCDGRHAVPLPPAAARPDRIYHNWKFCFAKFFKPFFA